MSWDRTNTTHATLSRVAFDDILDYALQVFLLCANNEIRDCKHETAHNKTIKSPP